MITGYCLLMKHLKSIFNFFKLPIKHFLILIFIMIAHGSAFPVAKLALNNSVPPILMASLRMGLVFILLIPFWKFKIQKKNTRMRPTSSAVMSPFV